MARVTLNPSTGTTPSTTYVEVPGAAGADGATGATATNGVNAYTTTTANFTMPANEASVAVSVVNSSWMALTQVVYVATAGYMQVTAITSTILVTLKNLEDGTLYAANVAPGTVIGSGVKITPGGWSGPQGPSGTGTMADQNANNVDISGGQIAGVTLSGAGGGNRFDPVVSITEGGTGDSSAAGARTSLGLAIGTDVQAYHAKLAALAGVAGAADKLAYFTGASTMDVTTLTTWMRSILAAADTPAISTLTAFAPDSGRIGPLSLGINLNLAGDTEIPDLTTWFTDYIIRRITLYSASGNINTATAGVYTNAGGAGTVLAAPQSLAAMDSAGSCMDLTLAVGATNRSWNLASLYFRVVTPQGGAAAALLRVFADNALIV